MASDKRALILHYDEEHDQIVCISIPAESALALREHDGFELPLSDLRALSPDEAERRVSAAVFGLLDSFAARKAGIRDYAGEFERDLQVMISELEIVAESGDAQAKYDLSVLYHDMAMRRRSWEYMKKAETLTREAAVLGVASAVKAIENWELMKRALERRIGGA